MASERAKELSSLIWFGAGAFLLAAMASYVEDVRPAAEAARWHNVCGAFGFVLARALLGHLGYAAYLIPIALISEGARLFGRLPSRPIALRAAGIVLFMPVLAAVLHELLGNFSTRIPDAGGDFGIWLAALLKQDSGLGAIGGRIALLLLLLITFVLYADLLYSRTFARALAWLDARGGVASLWRGRGESDERADGGAPDDPADADDDAATVAPSARKRGAPRLHGAAPSGALDVSNEELDAELERALADAPPPPKKGKKLPKRLVSAVDAAMASDAVEAEEEIAEPLDEEWNQPHLLKPVAATPPAVKPAAATSAVDDDARLDEADDAEAVADAEADADAVEAELDADARAPAARRGTAAALDEEEALDTGAAADADTAAANGAAAKPSLREKLAAKLKSVVAKPAASAAVAATGTAGAAGAAGAAATAAANAAAAAVGSAAAKSAAAPPRAGAAAKPAAHAPAAAPVPLAPETAAELEAEADIAALAVEAQKRAAKPALPVAPAALPALVQMPSAPERSKAPYQFPSFQLLDPPERDSGGDFIKFTEEAARKLTTALKSFKVDAKVVGVQRGPSITMLEVELAPGTKLTRLRALEDDLAMALAAQSVRIVAPIPNKSTAGIEIPNDARAVVRMSELLQWPGYNPQKYAIPICLGKDSSGAPRIEDLAKMPHLLVAGSTGSGKSVCLNTLIMSILFSRTPEQVKLILIDPKMVELSSFQNVPHLMCPVVTDMKRAAGILEWAVEKMEERYALLHKVEVRNIYAYNKLGEEEVKKRLGDEFAADFETTLPFIVIVMDELADLMLVHGKDVEQSITRLAQKSRAVGIHVILATQRPSTNVITGLIKANLPTRIAFRVTSKIDSRVILDQNGADKLLGQGDMLYVPPGTADLSRVQGCFVTDQEIRGVVDFLADQGPPQYSRELVQKRSSSDKDPSELDDLFDDAAKFVVETQRGSASLLQRRFSIGYTRASRLIDLMANDGLLGEFKGSQAREVLCTSLEELEARRAEQRAARGVKPGEPRGDDGGGAGREPGLTGGDGDEASDRFDDDEVDEEAKA
ncbi:MAG: DNA translocase FtsK 4TM domain-containing protein [Planctomycetes bacterium]|nr:DNA translocase FtsK 4TM domain-containing protein [Planctomycetota bacterium]